MLRSNLALGLSLFALSSLSAALQDSEAVVRNPEFAELSARWAAAMESLQVPGLAVAVVEGDTILHLETFGIRNPETHAEVTPETMFYIASATKPYVSLALLQLVDEGKLDLDAPVKQYLPQFQLADEQATRTITTRDLLCHRPGINSGPIVFLDAYTGGITDERYFHFLKDVVPTGSVRYSNLHLTLAGHVLQALDGMPWKDSLKQRIFEPTGMQHTTGYAIWMYAQENVAVPTVVEGDGFAFAPVRKTNETMHAAGGLGTSISDAAHWLQLQLGYGNWRGEQLVSEELMVDMFTQQSQASRGGGVDGFGLGWMHGLQEGEVMMQHGGGYVGTSTDFSFMPELGIGMVVLSNSSMGGRALGEVIREDIYAHLLGSELGHDRLPELITRVNSRRARPEESESLGKNPAQAEGALSLPVKSYLGLYRDTNWGDLELSWDGEALKGRMGNLPVSVHSLGPDHFELHTQIQNDWELQVLIEDGRVLALEPKEAGAAPNFRRVP